MSPFTVIRRHRFRASRLVAAVFAIAWLGFAAVPCQAAPDPGHCGSSHDGSIPENHCGHCPATTSDSDGCRQTVVTGPECLAAGPALFEHRDAGNPEPQAAAAPEFPNFDPFVPGGELRPGRILPPLVPRVSLQQRYCTFLK